MINNITLEDISVVIPTFNRRDLLKRAINSVINQTIKPNEIIVIDNGSTDQTYQMVSSLFPDIIFLTETKRGVSAARIKVSLKANQMDCLFRF